MIAIFKRLLAAEDGLAWLKRPNFAFRYGPDNKVQVGANSLGLNRPPTLNSLFKEWHIDLLEIALHKRCLTSAISGGAQPARRLLEKSCGYCLQAVQAA